jgi:DNA-binding transcriptional ArsR family regulator
MADFGKIPDWAEMLKAVAHPVRLMILAELLEGPKCVTAIRDLLKVRQPNISQHLLVLKHGGLVSFNRDGAFRCYYLPRPAQVRAIFRLLESDFPTVNSDEVRKKFRRAQHQKARR